MKYGNITITKITYITIAFFFAATTSTFANCSAMMAEAETAPSGVSVRLSDAGSVEAIFAMGEGTFLAPKRSLINKARISAELSAKRVFASWLEEAVAGGTVASQLMDQVEETNQNGDTSGTATEITQIGETMASATAAILSGLIKLDECVDTEKKYILVELGWKPELSKAASSVQSEMVSNQGSNVATSASGVNAGSTSKIVPADGYRKKSKLKDDF